MPKAEVQLLTAEWINQRIENVLDRVDVIVDHLIGDGLLASGYAPLEARLTPADIKKMSPDQIMALLASLNDPGERLAVLKALDIPLEGIYALREGAPGGVPQEGV